MSTTFPTVLPPRNSSLRPTQSSTASTPQAGRAPAYPSHYANTNTNNRTSTTAMATPNQTPGLRYPSNKKTIYDRNLNRSKNAELSRAAFAYLFVEMISYAQRHVKDIAALEKRYVFCPSHSYQHTPCHPIEVGIYDIVETGS